MATPVWHIAVGGVNSPCRIGDTFTDIHTPLVGESILLLRAAVAVWVATLIRVARGDATSMPTARQISENLLLLFFERRLLVGRVVLHLTIARFVFASLSEERGLLIFEHNEARLLTFEILDHKLGIFLLNFEVGFEVFVLFDNTSQSVSQTRKTHFLVNIARERLGRSHTLNRRNFATVIELSNNITNRLGVFLDAFFGGFDFSCKLFALGLFQLDLSAEAILLRAERVDFALDRIGLGSKSARLVFVLLHARANLRNLRIDIIEVLLGVGSSLRSRQRIC